MTLLRMFYWNFAIETLKYVPFYNLKGNISSVLVLCQVVTYIPRTYHVLVEKFICSATNLSHTFISVGDL
jgi:hypothetical protein